MEQHTAEVWVKVICILGYIGVALGFLGGIFLLVGGGFIVSMLSAMLPTGANTLLTTMTVVGGILFIVFAIVGFLVYMNLWKYKNWARIVIVIFSALGVLGAIFSLPAGIISLIINGGILYLLAFDKTVKALFK